MLDQLVRRLILGLAITAMVAAFASPAARAEDLGAVSSLETFRAAVRGQTLDAARWIDRLFAEEEFEEERVDASLRLRFDVDLDEDGGSFGTRPRLRMHLPGTTRRLLLELQGARESELGEGGFDFTDIFDDSAEDDPLELRLRLADPDGRTRIAPEIGVGYDDGDPTGFAGLRLRHAWQPDSTWAFYASERVRARTDTGLQSITVLRADRPLWGDSLLRADLRLDWSADEPGFRYTPGLRLFHPLSDVSGVAFEAQVELETEPEHTATRFLTGARYRTRVLTDWTSVEIAPRITFDESDDYDPRLGVLIRLDLEF
jgi:hypothetical protein